MAALLLALSRIPPATLRLSHMHAVIFAKHNSFQLYQLHAEQGGSVSSTFSLAWESEESRRTIGSPTCTYGGQFGFIRPLAYGSFLASQHDTYFSLFANCDRGLHQKQPRESRYSNDTTVVRSVLIHILFCEPEIPVFFSVRALRERPARGNEFPPVSDRAER